MDIGFCDADVQQLFNEWRRLVARYGNKGAQVIACRMLLLQAAPRLGLVPQHAPFNLQATAAPAAFTLDLDAGRRLRLAVNGPKYDRCGLLLWRDALKIDILGVVP